MIMESHPSPIKAQAVAPGVGRLSLEANCARGEEPACENLLTNLAAGLAVGAAVRGERGARVVLRTGTDALAALPARTEVLFAGGGAVAVALRSGGLASPEHGGDAARQHPQHPTPIRAGPEALDETIKAIRIHSCCPPFDNPEGTRPRPAATSTVPLWAGRAMFASIESRISRSTGHTPAYDESRRR